MATFVLVPGGYSGGWQWRTVAKSLRARGHEVFTPTLTGLGERVHLARPDTDLGTHIQDILNVIHFEDLGDVFLVGYSYSGMVITAVADSIPERLRHLIYLDAFVPEDGQSLADILGPQIVTMMRAVAEQYGEGWRVPHNPPDKPFTTPHPLNTAFQAVRLQNPKALALPRTFIFCTEDKASDPVLEPITQAAARVKNDAAWHYHELATGHLAYETMPQRVADILHERAEAHITAT
jgi:pimeloyl-ACP methyl ester carboxylesterase